MGLSSRSWADHILHIRQVYVGDINVRKMITQGTKTIEAGTRRTDLPPSISWGKDDAKNYKEFRALWES